MTTLGLVQILYVALAVVMAGLGLSLHWDDFVHLRSQSKGAVVALVLQMVVLPSLAIALIAAFRLDGYMAVGMVLLAATPGSITANLFSHLFGGDVAFNIALTGINTLLCALALPFLGTWAMGHYVGVTDQSLPVLGGRAMQTVIIIVLPVLVGMGIAAKAPRIAKSMDRPVKALSAILLITASVVAVVLEWHTLVRGFSRVGVAVLIFNGASLLMGLLVGRAYGLSASICTTIAFQVSIHNAIQAIYVGIAVLHETIAALPAAIYSISMNFIALGFGLLMLAVKRRPLKGTS